MFKQLALLVGKPRVFPAVAIALTCISGAVYLTAGRVAAGAFGYPIDDPWIHETLARNLLRHGELAINPGEPTAASTSLLWTVLLVPGELLGLAPLWWAYFLGAASLALVGIATYKFAQALLPESRVLPTVAGLLALLDWRLAWSGFSGMETLLFTGLSLLLLTSAMATEEGPAWKKGLVAGALTLVRPEGMLLAALVGATMLFGAPAAGKWRRITGYAGVLALCLLPLFAVNYRLNGQLLPATFTAKNAAYGVGVSVGAYVDYLWSALVILAPGVQLLLFLGLLYLLLRRPRGLNAWWPLPLWWGALLLSAYMIWLPALYHHGRYLFPVIPLIIVYGLTGGMKLLDRLPFTVLPRAVTAMLTLLALLSWARGAQIYAGDVAYIYNHQVTLAQWARDNTPPDAVIATHDIGAFGYYAQRRLVDIAGLASQELTTSPRDVERVLAVLEEKHVAYVFLLPSWYPPLSRALEETGAFKKVAVQPDLKQNETVEGLDSFLVWRRVSEKLE